VKIFIVKRDAQGLTVGRPLDKIGFRGLPVADVYLEKCEVSDDAIVGTAGGGNEIIKCAASLQSLVTAVSALGTARASMEEAIGYLKNRKGGGLSQSASFKCADMMIMADVSRLLIYQAAWAMDTRNPEGPILASGAKIFATDAAHQISNMVVELQGKDGCIVGSVSEKLSRDARFCAICGGTSEVQKDFVGISVLNNFRKEVEKKQV
ncbi:MAG: acyl-CoA dehydrogenase, partial [Deltaproteobacteria bacterium]|nr:acyl-CoA dehydrogenase [Deltaproteobacteria bacterium]